MSVIPQRLSYRYRFRNRIKNLKFRNHNQNQRGHKWNLTWQKFFNPTLNQTHAWLPRHRVKLQCLQPVAHDENSLADVNKGDVQLQNPSSMLATLKEAGTYLGTCCNPKNSTQKQTKGLTKVNHSILTSRYPTAHGYANLTLIQGEREQLGLSGVESFFKNASAGRGSFKGFSSCALFGKFALIFKTHGKLSAKLIQTFRLDIAKTVRKKGRVWLRLCADSPVTARPVEARMGKGKGSVQSWEAAVKPGQVYFEFAGLNQTKANQILNALRKKSPTTLKLCLG